MSTQKQDPIFDSLDRLAGLADADLVGDRMPGIQRRVRVSRQRKAAGIVAAAAVVAVGAVGISYGLPSDNAAPIVSPTKPWQQITIDADAPDAGHLQISYTVTGRSTAYSDPTTGQPADYAGPQHVTVLVDGKDVGGSDGGAISCEKNGALTRYDLRFYERKPLVVKVSAGEHRVAVQAPYCADGRLVKSTESVVVTSATGGFTIFDQLRADLDGDGTLEVVRVMAPKDETGESQQLQVTWGTGETTTAELPNTMETSLRDPIDLDGDGDLELILLGGGGDASIYSVYLADPAGLEQVKTVDAQGKALALHSDSDPTAWQTYVGDDGIYSYQRTDPAALEPPFQVEVRGWSLAGDTLIQSQDSVAQCATFDVIVVLGPC